MAEYKQTARPLAVTTPLGDDKLLLESLTGTEGISQPFQFELAMLAQPNYSVPFKDLLGQKISVRLDTSETAKRQFHGVVTRLSEGGEVLAADSGDRMLRYWCQIVPDFALLKHRVQTRIFQHLSVIEILKQVLTGITTAYEVQATLEPRDYCVQYQESDFDFASRLMEEEGIFYFFRHTSSSHTMVLADAATSHADMPEEVKVEFTDFSGQRDRRMHEDRIFGWQKTQEMRSSQYKAWDYCFQMPDKNLEATQAILATANVGTVAHSLKTNNDALTVYEYPGAYAKFRDDIDRGGAEQASDLQKVFNENTRLAKIRMQEETQSALTVVGEGNVRRFIPGYKFTLSGHPNANGSYLVTEVNHSANMEGSYTTAGSVTIKYGNRFRALPTDIPFRPLRDTPKPVVRGNQTAVVVGNSTEAEIFTDKYGRVKVQFPWHREGVKDLDSSCWIRVAQPSSGAQWGSVFLPRVGHEVIVSFIDGDPDQPIIVGCVYNSKNMPPYTLPENKTRSLIKTRSSEKGTAENFNELRFEDKKDSEEIYFHAEKDFNRVVENNDTLKVGFDKKDKGNQTIEVYQDRSITVEKGNETYLVKTGDRSVTIDTGNETRLIKTGNRTVTVETGNETYSIKKGNREATIDVGNDTHNIKTGNRTATIDQGDDNFKVTLGSSITEAGTAIELKVGGNSIVINTSGITIKGTMVTIEATGSLTVKGAIGEVSASGPLTVKGAIVQIN